jgi:hypothetical protein
VREPQRQGRQPDVAATACHPRCPERPAGRAARLVLSGRVHANHRSGRRPSPARTLHELARKHR